MDKEELFNYMRLKHGMVPFTDFVRYPDSVRVSMVDFPDISRVMCVLVDMSMSSWLPNYSKGLTAGEVEIAAHDLLSGSTLSLAMEALQFTFLVEGLTLHDSHALVRNRIGIVYAQQSQAVRDLRYDSALFPVSYERFPALFDRYKKWVADGKQLYSDLLDTKDVSVADARLSLPKTIPVWIYFSCNLSTLISLLEKRLCSQEESIGLNEMSRQIVCLVAEKFPFLEPYLKSACVKGRCFHQKQGFKSNCIYKRDSLHSIRGYSDEFTVHDKSKKVLSRGKQA